MATALQMSSSLGAPSSDLGCLREELEIAIRQALEAKAGKEDAVPMPSFVTPRPAPPAMPPMPRAWFGGFGMPSSQAGPAPPLSDRRGPPLTRAPGAWGAGANAQALGARLAYGNSNTYAPADRNQGEVGSPWAGHDGMLRQAFMGATPASTFDAATRPLPGFPPGLSPPFASVAVAKPPGSQGLWASPFQDRTPPRGATGCFKQPSPVAGGPPGIWSSTTPSTSPPRSPPPGAQTDSGSEQTTPPPTPLDASPRMSIQPAANDDHAAGTCKPCIYQHAGGCRKDTCAFCHLPHDNRQLRRVRPSKSTRRCLQRRATKTGEGDAEE
mmetsp:Transcript_115605/g.331945  ORF Transcript_115605/g.331945 Transcript_115605/m.331945 type:complete len:326 (-) Transcript_115605:91-1068(-)